jgi:hypothetical protein
MIQVVLAHHLRALAHIDGQVKLADTLLLLCNAMQRLAHGPGQWWNVLEVLG